MSHILDNIDSEKVYSYFHPDENSDAEIPNAAETVQSVIDFLEWAYDKDYLTFQKYQQIKDSIDNEDDYTLPEKAVSKPTPKLSNTDERENFFLKHAFIILPALTLTLFILGYFAFYPVSGSNIKGYLPDDFSTSEERSPIIANSNNTLTFQGQLTDSSGIPIEERTNVRFRLYDASTGGNVLYDSLKAGNCEVEPIVNGTVSVEIGKTCGPPLTDSLLDSASQLWLGLSVGTDPEMQPRKKLALSNEGLTLGAFSGQNNISSDEEGLLSSDNFTVSSPETLTLQSAGLGDVIVHASDSGHIRLLTGGSQAVDISNAGFVGINKDDPKYNLDVLGNVNIDAGQLKIGSFSDNPPKIGNGSLYFNTDDKKIYYHDGSSWKILGSEQETVNITDNGEAEYDYLTFRSEDGDILGQIEKNDLGGISYTSQGSDFAEFFRKDLTTSYNHDDYSPGSLICHSKSGGVAPCDTPSQYIVGVVSDNPAFIGNTLFSNNNDYTLVGLVGQLDVKVYNDGSLKQGDALSMSTYPGYAKKADQKGYIVGYAQETPSERGLTSVKVHIQPSFYDPTIYAGVDEESDTYLGAVSSFVADLIEAVTIKTQTLIADIIKATSGDFDTLSASDIQGGSIKVDSIEAANIESDNIDELRENIERVAEKTDLETVVLSSIEPAIGGLELDATSDELTLETKNADAGEGILRGGTKSIQIFNNNVKSTSLIYLTTTSPTQNRTVYVAEKVGCDYINTTGSTQTNICKPHFKVAIDAPIEQDITFNWWILQE